MFCWVCVEVEEAAVHAVCRHAPVAVVGSYTGRCIAHGGNERFDASVAGCRATKPELALGTVLVTKLPANRHLCGLLVGYIQPTASFREPGHVQRNARESRGLRVVRVVHGAGAVDNIDMDGLPPALQRRPRGRAVFERVDRCLVRLDDVWAPIPTKISHPTSYIVC